MAAARGFTLVENAIILVVVGLLLGGALVSVEMVNGAKVRNLAHDFRSVPTYLLAYQGLYRALPGDDPQVAMRLPGAAAATTPAARQGNGVIDGAWNSTTASDETRLFWQHVRRAELVTGPLDPADPHYTPRNALGGMVGVSSQGAGQRQINGMKGEYQICSSGLPAKFARQLDLAMDDGDTAEGLMRAVPDGAPLPAPPTALAELDESRNYTVCMAF